MLLPILNLVAAFVVSGLVVLVLGESPWQLIEVLVTGSFGNLEALGFTLYYTTSFIFTGLAVAVAFHCGLFNIGGEGQAYLGGLGVALVCLAFDWLPFVVVLPLALIGAMAFGAAWAYVPGWLQARRGSHIVITTIMFNFIAAALMTYLLVDVLIKPGPATPETREFADLVWMPPTASSWRRWASRSRARRSMFRSSFALFCRLRVWLYVWHTRWGYELRAFGNNEPGAATRHHPRSGRSWSS